jgi:2-polyprenyl-3-methyl-5-hydroxy-6-metoxy-1,4-benzoquinol methylase
MESMNMITDILGSDIPETPAPPAALKPQTRSRERRWSEEAAFFNAEAERSGASGLAVDPLALARYSRPSPRRRFNKEFRFRIMGPLAGKRILDVGCGSGLNAVQFAKLGATVTGIDLSSGELEIARRSAELNGVSDRAGFICSPIEIADVPDDSFDIVWVDAVLHHVLDELELVLKRLVRWVKPGGLLVFAEPVNLCEPLRRLRKMIPAVAANGTPGERPLVPAELELVLRHLDGPRLRHYMLFGRLDRFILTNHKYERSPWPRRVLSNSIALLDYALLSIPGIRRLAGACVVYGRPRKGRF